MKTFHGFFACSAALLMPLLSSRASEPTLNNRATTDFARLTLLTGPNLTSWAHGPIPARPSALQSTEPDRKSPRPDRGTLHLSTEDPNRIVVPASNNKLPPAESLRFDQTLHTPPATKVQFTPAPKRP